ncbi:hypothetical protein J6590_019134 [Homalodisca vitripennis]|nr:hypothetical protein J6590_019134 [Homalodisca vitripennis]
MDLPNKVEHRMWMQEDGTPRHYAIAVHNTLNDQFPDKWIGRAATISYPIHSPDLTYLDYPWGRGYNGKSKKRNSFQFSIRNPAFKTASVGGWSFALTKKGNSLNT